MAPDFDPAVIGEWALVPRRIFDGRALHQGLALHLRDGLVAALCPPSDLPPGLPVWHTDTTAVPGYFDVQVNGGGGVLVNTTPTPQGLLAIAAAHCQSGTTSCLPTLITDRPEVMDRVADAVIRVCGTGGVAGIHLEGPHISPARKGTHNPAFIRPLDARTMAAARRLRAAGVPVLLTLAPEMAAPGAIAELTAAGVVVSLGHTAGDAAGVRQAIAEGARAATHLYNAMTHMESREPGVVGAVIDSDLYAGFIADGHHVDDAMLRIAIRARPRAGRMVLVSDAMPTWNGPDHFDLYGERIALRDGRLVNAAGSLAGVHIDMAHSVQRLVQRIGLPLAEALGMATANPAEMMRLDRRIGTLVAGAQADFVLLDQGLAPTAVVVGGKMHASPVA